MAGLGRFGYSAYSAVEWLGTRSRSPHAAVAHLPHLPQVSILNSETAERRQKKIKHGKKQYSFIKKFENLSVSQEDQQQ